MEEKKEFKLFREKSLEAIESPESMNDYLQVTSPGVWIVLAAIIAILIGAVLWSVFGRINTTVDVAVECSGEGRTCYVPYDNLESVMSAGHVTVDGNEYALQMDTDTKTLIVSTSEVHRWIISPVLLAPCHAKGRHMIFSNRLSRMRLTNFSAAISLKRRNRNRHRDRYRDRSRNGYRYPSRF